MWKEQIYEKHLENIKDMLARKKSREKYYMDGGPRGEFIRKYGRHIPQGSFIRPSVHSSNYKDQFGLSMSENIGAGRYKQGMFDKVVKKRLDQLRELEVQNETGSLI